MPTFREKLVYGTPTQLTMAWASLAFDVNLLAGVQSAVINNETEGLLDVILGGEVAVASSGLTANRAIEIWAVAAFNDTDWPSPFNASAGAKTITLAANKISFCKYIHAWATSSTGTLTYRFSGVSLANAFGGVLPRRCALFGTQSTGAALPSSGHVMDMQPVYRQIATV